MREGGWVFSVVAESEGSMLEHASVADDHEVRLGPSVQEPLVGSYSNDHHHVAQKHQLNRMHSSLLLKKSG
jgi:hypothetical protein